MDAIAVGDEGVRRRADADTAQVHRDWTVGVAKTAHVRAECVAFGEQ